jgi:hypothetical protein
MSIGQEGMKVRFQAVVNQLITRNVCIWIISKLVDKKKGNFM